MKWDEFERLVVKARREAPPTIDVTASVARSIGLRRAEPAETWLRPLLVTASSLATAACVAFICFPTWSAETSALAFLFESLVAGLP